MDEYQDPIQDDRANPLARGEDQNIPPLSKEEWDAETWPKTLILTRTYTRQFDTKEEVLERIYNVMRDRGIWHPSDLKAKEVFGADEGDGGREYNDETEKSSFEEYYQDITWPPKTLEDFAKITQQDLDREDIYPDDEFEGVSTYEMSVE